MADATVQPGQSVNPEADAWDGGPEPRIDRLDVAVYTVPTDGPESDGTWAWDSTTMVLVDVAAAGCHGLGYTYGDPVAARLIEGTLAARILGRGAWATAALQQSMVAAVRNAGRPGIAATAISAVDVALWDLKARLLGRSLVDLIGPCHDSVVAYGSGGFTSYDDGRLARQLGGWAEDGFAAVKMKVGRDPEADPRRVGVARAAIGPHVRLFVDANGAHGRRDALAAANQFAASDVRWFEEPVSSDDREGLRWLRSQVPAAMAVAAGEYAWGPDASLSLLRDDAVDVLQLDATRCLGITGFLSSAALAAGFHVPVSAHCAPAIHTTLMAATAHGVHLEWFHDHVRIEQRFFDGAPEVHAGRVSPGRTRAGLGLSLRTEAARPYLQWRS